MPRRIQRKRTKGWRMPEGAIYVGRPTKWGNPFRPRVTFCDVYGYWWDDPRDNAEAVNFYREWLESGAGNLCDIDELRGKDLACWCPLVDEQGVRVPCHADVLLELANVRPSDKDETQ